MNDGYGLLNLQLSSIRWHYLFYFHSIDFRTIEYFNIINYHTNSKGQTTCRFLITK